MDEAQAIALASAGDQRAFAGIIARYKHMVYTAAYRILRNRQEAEEATQDSFVKAYQNLTSYQGGSKFSTWLFSIAYRTSISQLRKRRQPMSEIDGLGSSEPGAWDIPSSEASDRKAVLERALSSLDPDDAAVISFFYLEEMSVDEIVTVTGLGASNVKVKLHRSRKKLLDILKDQLKEEVWSLGVN